MAVLVVGNGIPVLAECEVDVDALSAEVRALVVWTLAGRRPHAPSLTKPMLSSGLLSTALSVLLACWQVSSVLAAPSRCSLS